MSTAGAGQGARRPERWCGHGHQASRFMGKVPVSSDGWTTLSNMCSGAGSGADGSAGGAGAGSAGCLDPMLDRLLAVEVAGLPDSALAADLLVELARRALDGAALPSVGGERPHIQIRVDYATLLARTATL